MSLSKQEFAVLQELQRDPMIKYSHLAKRLKISQTTLRKILRSLGAVEDKKVELGQRTPIITMAMYEWAILGLKRASFHVICKNVAQMRAVELFCDAHPYTSYRMRIFGGNPGLYLLFFTPPEGLRYLEEALTHLQDRGFIDHFVTLVGEPTYDVNTFPDYTAYDPKSGAWAFDIKDFAVRLNRLGSDSTTAVSPETRSQLSQVEPVDLMILREWTYGAGPRKQISEILANFEKDDLGVYKEELERYTVDRHIISKRINKINDMGLVRNYRVWFDQEKVLIFNRTFLWGTADFDFLSKLARVLKEGRSFPFNSVLAVGPPDSSNIAQYVWWVELPPKETAALVNWLFEKTMELRTSLVSDRYNDSAVYYFYHKNFVPNQSGKGGSWRVSKEYCLDEPLSSVPSMEE